MDKQYAIFDMDGTLLDSMYFWRNLDQTYMESKGIELTDKLRDAMKGLTMKETIAYINEHFGFNDSAEDLSRAAREAMAAFYRDDVELKEGVREYLDYLRDQGVLMAVATLTPMSLTKPALEKHGIWDYFETVLTCSDLGINKHTPEVFEMAATHMGCTPAEAAVFEDTPRSLQSAVEGGFYSVLVYDEHMADEQVSVRDIADAYCVDMNELRVDSVLKRVSKQA